LSYKTDFSKIDLDKYFFDEKAADSAVRYIETQIRHVKGELAGELIKLEEWQKNEIIKPLFGWKDKETGLRKYNSAYIEIPKKSGKSFLAACMAAIFLDIEPEGGSEVVGVAWGRKQASLVFDATKEVIKKSPRLKKRCEIFKNSILVQDDQRGLCTYKILSKEAGGEDGINPQLAIIDELHVHKNNEVLEMVEKSMGARRQPLSFVITTAGSDLYGIGRQRHEYARDVTLGKIQDENMLVCIYCADLEDDPFAEATWKKANPNYGVSVYKHSYEREAKKAVVSPASLNSFKRYYLNIWTQSKTAWIPDHVWKASQWELVEDLEGRECYAGLDLSSRSDITALTLLFPLDGGRYVSKNWFWLPEDKGQGAIEENKNIQYLQWIKDEYIVETPGNTIDYEFILFELAELRQKYDIKVIAYDEWNSSHIAPQLHEMNMALQPFRQGYKSMNLPTKELEKLIMDKKFNHLGNPVLQWMAGNAVIQSDPAGNIKVIKDVKSKNKKVDGIISNVMALGMALAEQVDESYLNKTGGEIYTI
jgi:phage terminase large subunit-like protein